jgi:hypothetical protein
VTGVQLAKAAETPAVFSSVVHGLNVLGGCHLGRAVLKAKRADYDGEPTGTLIHSQLPGDPGCLARMLVVAPDQDPSRAL